MRALLPLLVLLACGSSVEPPGATVRSAIVGGALEPGTDAVFLLDLRFDNGQAAVCSAVLVSPRVLLTAAHCVEPALRGASSVMVRATNRADATTLRMSDVIEVTTLRRAPGWSPQGTGNPNDLGALLLARAPTGVAPLPVRRTAVVVGTPLRAVGYGVTARGAGDSLLRRSVQATITAVDRSTFDFGVAGTRGICDGDSGGPSLGAGEEVLGIHSATFSRDCGVGTDVRVDAQLPFIDGFVEAMDPSPRCGADARCLPGCTPVDPDCPLACGADATCNQDCAAADPDCAADGQPCTSGATCAGQRCVLQGGGPGRCARSCQAPSDCAVGLTCLEGLCQADASPLRGGCAAVPSGGVPVVAVLCAWLLSRRAAGRQRASGRKGTASPRRRRRSCDSLAIS